jgi:hypothetical protein
MLFGLTLHLCVCRAAMSQVYREAAEVLSGFLSGAGGIKALAYAPAIKQKKAVYALVLNTLKCTSVGVVMCCLLCYMF